MKLKKEVNWDKVISFIKDRKVPISKLAAVINLGVPQTHEKIHGTRGRKCNDTEKTLIISEIYKIKKELDLIFKS